MSKKQIKNILEELYKIDKSLKSYGPQLEEIVVRLIEAKPDIVIDEEFKKGLYQELMAKAGELKPLKNKGVNLWQWIFARKLSYAFVGAVVIVVLMVGINYLVSKNRIEPFQPQSGSGNEFNKIVLSDNAFGSLAIAEGDQQAQQLDTTGVPAGRGGGGVGGSGADSSTISVMPEKIAQCVSGETGCIIPPYIYPEYTYTGGEINLDQSQVEVLRKKSKIEYASSFAGFLETFGFGLADLSAFDNTRIQTINLVQDKEFGYTIFINLDEGIISMDMNWLKWPQQQLENQLRESDILSDEELIKITNQFIGEHRINMGSYGQPEVENTWRGDYVIAKAESRFYAPEIISVLYPLLIDGKQVYEQWGGKVGVRINVNLRYKRVSGLYNLSFQDYESSKYEAETDASRIIKIAERGGLNMYYYIMEGVETTKIELDTPIQAYMIFWKYDETSRSNQILFIPALVFPIKNLPAEGYYYQKNIIVPLAKELLDQNEQPPYPVPLMKEAQ